MSQDFSKGKIYKITNDYNDDIYVGSTCDTLVRRFNSHHASSKVAKEKDRPIYKLFNELGFNRFRIELICNYPCEDKYQLRQKEGEYIRQIGTLNCCIAGQKYSESENKKIADKKYRKAHKEELRGKQCQKFECKCGIIYTMSNKARHEKTEKHKKLIELLNNQNSVEVSPETFIN